MAEKGFPIPILFTVFNRPDIAAATFARIREARPERLFIAADGPRPGRPDDERLCAETRALAGKVDWPCEVSTRFSPANLGLKKGMSSAIDWFFGQVEEGIILEDDCKPDLAFFRYCEWALGKWRDEPAVMAVSGANYQFGVRRGPDSVYFSRILACWGWATWRRAWAHFDLGMKEFPAFEKEGRIRRIFAHRLPREFWLAKMKACHEGGNSWAFAWIFNIISRGGLVATPNANLVTNVGFEDGATNATDKASVFSHIPIGDLGPVLTAPARIAADEDADLHFTRILAKEQFVERGLLFRAKRLVKAVVPKALLPRRK